MKLSQTLKAVALSGAILGVQPGCAVETMETNLCEIRGTNPNGAVMKSLADVKEFCHYYRDAVITCVQNARGCPISNASTTTCSNLQSNQIIADAETMDRLNGSFFITCVEGNGYIPTRE